MSALFLSKKELSKKHKFFIFLKGHYLLMGGPIDINDGELWENSVGFLEIVVL